MDVGASGDIFKVFQVKRKTKATKQNEGMVLTSEPRQFKKLNMPKKHSFQPWRSAIPQTTSLRVFS